MLAHIIQELTKGCQNLTLEELEEGILLCSKLLSKVTPSTNVVDSGRTTPSPRHLISTSSNPTEEGVNDVQESQNRKENGDKETQKKDELHSSKESIEDLSREVSRDERSPRDNGSRVNKGSRAREGSRGNQESREIKDKDPDLKVAKEGDVDPVNGGSFRTPRFERDDGGLEGNDNVDGSEELNERENEHRGKDLGSSGDLEINKSAKGSVDFEERKDIGRKEDAKEREDVGGRKNSERKENGKGGKSTDTRDNPKGKKSAKKEKRKERQKDKGENEQRVKKDEKKEANRMKDEVRHVEIEEDEKQEDSVLIVKTRDVEQPRGIDEAKVEMDIKQVSQSALVRDCIKHFQTFVEEFFRCKILHSKKAKAFVEDDTLSEINKLEVITQGAQRNEKAGCGAVDEECRDTVLSGLTKTYTATCKLLVELSCFPMQNKETESEVSSRPEKGKSLDTIFISSSAMLHLLCFSQL